MELFDTHCHLNLSPLVDNLELALSEARAAGVSTWLVPGVKPSDWEKIHEISDYSSIFPAFGIHPAYVSCSTEADLALLDSIAASATAIGEIGLDRNAGNEILQEQFFREQIRIAKRHSLPLLIHCCKRTGRTLQILKEERAEMAGGIMHSFSGSIESAREFIRLGFAISVSGAVTRPEAKRLHDVAAILPLHSLVIETDAPFMEPQSHRGCPNRPAWLSDTLHTLADIRSTSPDYIASSTNTNSRSILRLPEHQNKWAPHTTRRYY